ncbi:mechanosensitive ion channel domain-containing protein [Algoriphagus sp. CAU 1675]|uniref:mechanosensitive ion channel family protein n=1 Tax=Algoriphagus sp. CAU 1675 TaxID=3032597 RepID=UPI0023D99196|nr:mechanosensitive ion channel domain-containing protein [Algoriphagus sp. CAU 1675]MDF2159109.1 mechanosensitive ion channel [Algoriphagus sp. CAU 1675]
MEIKFIESGAIVALYLLMRLITGKVIDKTINNNLLQKGRGKIIKKAINILGLVITIFIFFLIWGVNQSELIKFLSYGITVVGVAMFAQWSILSNITASVIIFFSHPIRIEDRVRIFDKDYEIEGKISDIGLFFTKIKNSDGEIITIPNNVFLQKMIKKESK